MSNWLGPALLAITKGRSAQLAGQQQTQANEDAVKMKQLQLAIQAAKAKKAETPLKWETQTAGDGSLVQVNPITGETRPLSLGGQPMKQFQKPEKPSNPLIGSPEWKAAEIEKAKIAAQYGYHPPKEESSHFSFQVGTDANGAPVIYAGNTKTGQITSTGVGKPQAASGSGVGQLTPGALEGMRAQAQEADKIMSRFEQDYAAGKIHLGVMDKGMAEGASQKQTGLLSGISSALSNKALGATNPRYQEYMAAQQRFGNIMGNLMSRRYTEHQGTLDTNLAGMAPNDAANTISLKKSYRSDLLNNFPSAGGAPMPSGGSAGGSTATPAQKARAAADPAYAAFLVAKGVKF